MSPDAVTTAARIPIVDDDVSLTDTYSRILRLEGYEVWAVLSADGASAWRRCIDRTLSFPACECR